MRNSEGRGGYLGFSRTIYLLGTSNLVMSAGRSAAGLFLPILLYTAYHLSFLFVGLLIALVVPVSLVASLAGGAASDHYGRRPFLAYPPLANAAVAFLLFLFWDRGLFVIMGLWAANTFLGNIGGGAQSAIMTDVSEERRRMSVFGLLRIFGNVGFAISPALGGLLAGFFGIPIVFLLSGIAGVGGGLLLTIFLEEPPHGVPSAPRPLREKVGVPFRDPIFLSLGLLGIGLTLATGQFGTALSLFSVGVRHFSYAQVGVLYSLNGIIVVTLQLPIAWGIRGHHLQWIAVGTLCYGAAFLLIDAGAAYAVALVAIGILTIGENLVSPLQNTTVAAVASSDARGSYFGAYSAITTSASIFAPPLGTILLGTGNSLALWGTMAVLTVVVAAGYLVLGRRWPRDLG
ncbi:MAG TPA: MFS transporter [Thermoplasmata archaeon]|nr:MFS transporter [Thermoplasmata archaeon]